ncbi:rho-related GTP-binding protein RhoU-like [Carettochelys insculpta]|uniref:rho-related GTP-binding protein RhoU-like n=1 Tax=Carettochelys insculpta TaxID=44489 RepID=UPI003EBEE13F
MPPQRLLPERPPVPPHRPARPQRQRELQCVLLGDGAVGKTSLAVSYSANGFPARYVPTALDRFSAVVQVDSVPVRLHLCDTAGQDEFDTLRRLCYPRADVVLLCFSVVAPASFQNVGDRWVPELRWHCPGVPLLLVGTQSDLRHDAQVLVRLAQSQEKPVTELAARALVQKVGAVGYVECSALTQQNLKEVFDTAILAGLRQAESRGLRARGTASKVRALSRAWWKKYVCVR